MINEMRRAAREVIEHRRPCWMNIISFKKIDLSDVIVKVVDKSSEGVGIESSDSVDPGFIWFTEKINGHRGGLLMWSKKVDSLYRGGIKFVSLSAEEERTIEEKFAEEGSPKDAMTIAETIFRKREGGYFVQTGS